MMKVGNSMCTLKELSFTIALILHIVLFGAIAADARELRVVERGSYEQPDEVMDNEWEPMGLFTQVPMPQQLPPPPPPPLPPLESPAPNCVSPPSTLPSPTSNPSPSSQVPSTLPSPSTNPSSPPSTLPSPTSNPTPPFLPAQGPPPPCLPTQGPPPLQPGPPTGIPTPPATHDPTVPVMPYTPPAAGKKPGSGSWCVAKPTVSDTVLQRALDYACGTGADCKMIQPTGPCFQPNTVSAHSSFAFNSYWQKGKAAGGSCDFGGTAMIVTIDPSATVGVSSRPTSRLSWSQTRRKKGKKISSHPIDNIFFHER
ncbi:PLASMODESMATA CALLOSE-BINDING PROTEIN 3 [Linum perenne]